MAEEMLGPRSYQRNVSPSAETQVICPGVAGPYREYQLKTNHSGEGMLSIGNEQFTVMRYGIEPGHNVRGSYIPVVSEDGFQTSLRLLVDIDSKKCYWEDYTDFRTQ